MSDFFDDAPLRMISLWQPWAHLVATGAKPWETRSFRPPSARIGQRIAIHAAKKRLTARERATLSPQILQLLGGDWPERCVYGAVLCTAQLVAAYQIMPPLDLSGPAANPTLSGYGAIADDGLGDYAPGRWCWRLIEVRPLPSPVPAQGGQGWLLWQPPSGSSP